VIIILHIKAKESFDSKANELLQLVEKIQRPSKGNKEFDSDFFCNTITEKDIIGDIKIGYTDGFGEDKGKIFIFQNEKYGIVGDNYEQLENVALNIYRIRDIQQKVSYHFVVETLFCWIRDKSIKNLETTFTDFLEKGINDVVDDYELWIPVPFTAIEKSFSIGEIEFRKISEDVIHSWFEDANKNIAPKELENFNEFKLRIKRDFQGYAAGVYKCKAEAKRAEEFAYEHFSKSLSILRVFSNANLFHEVVNASYEFGFKMIRMKHFFIHKGSNGSTSYKGGVVDNGFNWGITANDINWMNKYIPTINRVLANENLNDFQEKVFEALAMYSKNILRYDISDKILYILVALETMLLKNSNEPIQQNVGERLAFVLGKNAEDRIVIVRTLRDIYAMRSKFVHHGKVIEENKELLRMFMNNAWIFFMMMIGNLEKYNTKDDFLLELDLKKFS